jgi:hypothetical protein
MAEIVISASLSCHACTYTGLVIYIYVLCDEQEWPQERPEWSEFGLKPRTEDHQDKMEVQEDVIVEVRGGASMIHKFLRYCLVGG